MTIDKVLSSVNWKFLFTFDEREHHTSINEVLSKVFLLDLLPSVLAVQRFFDLLDFLLGD